ncbi:MAG: bifunctional 4-hydroxy-2-oxoglutarate aldolase/2-dehydro-3-deoxy-phosphogluconate aldolase [Eubacterium sp.]|nr:bifunctional 4-hydroxy-2-oxoglutarate aldolase/2-dehydro-3-deoxy-phosphogluconate aldolase [Eubacterium sp.]
MDVNKKVEELKIVPVVVLQEVKDAVPLAKALVEGGLPVAEVTFRTAAAADSIKAIREAYPDMLVGAGTVVNTEQALKAKEAGAQFIVTPGFSREVVQFAIVNGIPVFPGCCTPTEVVMAMEFGLKVVKFFPASRYGGLETIKALGGPFPQIRFMPTGGINAGNIKEYLEDPKVIACGGSWMVKESLIKEGKFDEITKMTKEAVELVTA